MAEDERIEKNKELKIKRRDYTGYDDDEFEEGKQGMKRAVLSKYDEFLEGPKQTVSLLPLAPSLSHSSYCRNSDSVALLRRRSRPRRPMAMLLFPLRSRFFQ